MRATAATAGRPPRRSSHDLQGRRRGPGRQPLHRRLVTINRIRRVGPDGIITTVAGDGHTPASAATAGRPPRRISIVPQAIAVGPDGSLYIADH